MGYLEEHRKQLKYEKTALSPSATRTGWQNISPWPFRGFVLILTVYAVIQGKFTWWDPLWILLFHHLWYILGLEIPTHRLAAHRAFSTPLWVRNILLSIGVLLCHPPSLPWMSTHRMHHKYSDTKYDPHSPYNRKFGVLNYIMIPIYDSMFPWEFANDQYFMWLYRWQFWLIWVSAIIVLSIFGMHTFLIVYGIPSAISAFMLGAANYYAHMGEFNGHDYTKNRYWLELIAPGMGFHKTHHDHPSRWNLCNRYPILDVSSWIIWLIKKRN